MSASELLRQFYGLDESGKSADPSDMNGSEFDAEAFFTSLINTKSLDQVTRDYHKLENDIIQLDSDLQTLVYNNYTKFIQASETVNSMKTGLSSLSSQMKSLLNGLASISEQAREIRDDLNPNREKISRLFGISGLLKKIDFISQLPLKLRAHVEIGNYEAAVEIWMKAERVLETQTHFESFVRIRDECKTIVDEIKVRVRAKMMDESTLPTEAITCAATLIKLQMPADSILEELMKVRTKVASDKIEAVPKEDDVFKQIETLDIGIVDHIKEFIRGYSKSLLAFSKPLANQHNREDPMDEHLRNFKRDMFKKCTRLFSLKDICELPSGKFAEFLDLFLAKIGAIGLFQQKASFGQQVLQKFIESKFCVLEEKTHKAIVESDPAQRVDQTFTEIIKLFKSECSRLVVEFEDLTKEQSDSKNLIIQAMSKLLKRLLDKFRTCEEQYSLLTFGVCYSFSVHVIPFAYDMVSRFDPQSPLLKIQPALQDEATQVAQVCLDLYVWTKRKMLSELLGQGMTSTDWANARVPHDVSIFTRLVIEELALIWVQVQAVLDKVNGSGDRDSQASSVSAKQKPLSAFSGSTFGGHQDTIFIGLRDDNIHQIDRLFTTINRLHLGKKCEFDSRSILTRISMYTLKTMLEFVRVYAFSCAGFNQIQVDAYFIYKTIVDRIEEPSLLGALIEEMLSSAAERTVNPNPFKPAVLIDIYSRSESKPHIRDTD